MLRFGYGDTIAIGKPIKCGNKCSAIVSDDFLNSSPLTQEIFKDKGGECSCSFNIEGMPFRPSSEGAVCLHDVAKTSGGRH